MVVDTSALVAILQNEPERRKFNEAIEAAEARSMSTASFLETSLILEWRVGADGVRDLDFYSSPKHRSPWYLSMRSKPTWPVTGFGNTARGDILQGSTMETALPTLARSRDEPLLFKGQDFLKTDVECHPASG